MRLGVAWEASNGANYRAVGPMQEMERRGHEVVWPHDETGEVDGRLLASCDLVHLYQHSSLDAKHAMAALTRAGTAITWDNDVDITSLPKESPLYKALGGLAGRRLLAQQVKTARLAQTVVTPTEHLAERYRRAGLPRVEVVENAYFAPETYKQGSHSGLVIGWVAGHEHRADVARVPIVDALRRILSEYRDVRVECIGVNLGLDERYRHDEAVPFDELLARLPHFDIGIAPLADIPFNLARSDVKLKEYAAAEVAWLASPVGPYAGLGPKQGGRVVPDGEWYEALRWMIVKEDQRKRLAGNGLAWARETSIKAVGPEWERVFSEAIRMRGEQGEQSSANARSR